MGREIRSKRGSRGPTEMQINDFNQLVQIHICDGVTPHSLQFLSVAVIVALTVALVAGYHIYIINLKTKKTSFFFTGKRWGGISSRNGGQ